MPLFTVFPPLAPSLLTLADFANLDAIDPVGPFLLPTGKAADLKNLADFIQVPLDLKVDDRFDADGISLKGRFELTAKIGQGGMGVFNKIFDHKQQREVGLKALLKNADEEAMLRFDNEIKIGSKLDHDHLVPVYETIEFYNGTRAMVMQFIDGPSLTKVMHRLDYRQAIDVFLDVCSGVSHMHAQGIVHRDLKPDNILIRSKDGRAFVTDFGIAKFLKEASTARADLSASPSSQSPDLTGGHMIGTVGYMDPKYAASAERQDIFSLGVILYQLMSRGRQPFRSYDAKGAQVPEPAIKIATRAHLWAKAIENRKNPEWRIPPLLGFAKEQADYLPEEMRRIIDKCLHPDLRLRYRTVDDLMADLLTVKAASLKKEIDAVETYLEGAMQIELSVFLMRSGLSIDPALNPQEMTDQELSDLLSSPVGRKDGKILVTAGTRDFLPPLERQALDDLDVRLEKKISLWLTEIGFMAHRILAKGWPLKHLIAKSYFDYLAHRQYELSAEEIQAFIPWVTTYEAPGGPMTRALTGALPVAIEDMRDFVTGDYVQTATTPTLYRIEPIKNGRDETGQFRRGEELDVSGLSIGLGEVLVLELSNDDYAPLSIPIQVSLKRRKELIDRGLPLTIVPELIPKSLVPEGFTVIPGGESVVGVRYGQRDARYGIPQTAFRYDPFAVKTATLGDYLKKFILPLVKSGRADEAEKLAPRSGKQLFIDIDRENRTIDVHEKDPGGNPISLTQNVRGVTPNDLFAFAQYLGLEIIDSFRWEIVATNAIEGWTGPIGAVRPINLPSFNGLANWFTTPDKKIELPRDPSDIEIPEMDSIPPGAERSENVTLVHGIQGVLGPGLHATSTPGTLNNIVTKGVSITATTDAVNFNARKEQMRPKRLPFQISDYAALLIKKFYRRK